MTPESLERLERRVDDLIAACRRLKSENAVLEAHQKELELAHEALKDRAQRARHRIETVISRLKRLERGSSP